MEQFFNRLENYNIFNYILPAIIFDIGCRLYIDIELIPKDNPVLAVFIYYFIGLVISRVGSLIVKPLLWKSKTMNSKFSSESTDFYVAEQKDPKIKILFTDYNMYRNFIATFLLLLLFKLSRCFIDYFNVNSCIYYTIICLLLILIFTLSYKKQLYYIHKRIDYSKKENEDKK
ncbi:MAG: hypothetical protein IJ220_09205 [Clostridia bacterium]|nr:hypothetical protein [Clostridia bacterium]